MNCENMWLYFGIFLALFLIYFILFHYNLIHAFRLSLKISGPTALPFIGNGLLFWTDSSTGIFCYKSIYWIGNPFGIYSTYLIYSVYTEIFNVILKILKDNGEFFRIWLGTELNVVIRNPKDIEVREYIIRSSNWPI